MSTTEFSAEELIRNLDPETIARELDALESELVGVNVPDLLDPPGCAGTPRNRAERRALESFRRREKKRGAPAHSPPPVSASVKPAKPAADTVDASEEMPRVYLRIWSDTRGPLFEDPIAVASRAIALGAVTQIALVGTDRGVASRAGRYNGEHAKHWPHAKSPATGEQFAKATALLADLSRAARETSEHYWPVAIHSTLQRYRRDLDPEGQLGLIGWARLLAGVFQTSDESLRVRCARTLLSWTADDARKVGRGKPENYTEDERDLFGDVRERFGPDFEGGDEPASPPAPPARRTDSRAPT